MRGKVTKTKELQGNSQSWKGNEGPFSDWRHFEQQGSWRFCYWELKMLVSLHGLLCSTWKFYHIFCLIFCDFWYQSWLEQASESGILYVFSMQDIVQWSKKLPHRAMPVWNLYKKFQLPTTNVHWDVGCFNRRFPLYLCAMKDRVEHHSSCHI